MKATVNFSPRPKLRVKYGKKGGVKYKVNNERPAQETTPSAPQEQEAGSSAPEQTQTQVSPPPAATEKAPQTGGQEDNRLFAAMAYLWILVLVPLLVKKDEEFVKFHTKQGLVFLALTVALILVSWVVGWIPLLGFLVALVCLFVIVVDLYAALQALQGKRWKVPLLGEWAEKINL
jgi:uncharacterized membrane protein